MRRGAASRGIARFAFESWQPYQMHIPTALARKSHRVALRRADSRTRESLSLHHVSVTDIYRTYIAVKEIRSPARGRPLNIDTGGVEEYVAREWTPRAVRRRRQTLDRKSTPRNRVSDNVRIEKRTVPDKRPGGSAAAIFARTGLSMLEQRT